MQRLLKIFERIIGKKTERPRMIASHDGKTGPDELTALATWTNRVISDAVKFAPPGMKLNIIVTSTIDDKFGGSGESK